MHARAHTHTRLPGDRLGLKSLAACMANGSVGPVLTVSLESRCRRRCASVPALILSLLDGGDELSSREAAILGLSVALGYIKPIAVTCIACGCASLFRVLSQYVMSSDIHTHIPGALGE